MSRDVFESLREINASLHDIHKEARRRWRDDAGAGSELTDEVGGVSVVLKYEGSNRNTDYRSVLLDGHLFAREWETIPWNVFKPIAVGYTVFMDLSMASTTKFINSIQPIGKVGIEEERYPPEDKSKARYYVHCSELEDVVALWKLWKPRYLPKQ